MSATAIGSPPDGASAGPDEDGAMTTLIDQRTARQVGDVMHRGVVSCPRWTPLRGVAELMASHRIHCVVVSDYGEEADEDHGLFGIVSDRDIAEAIAAQAIEGRDAGGTAATPLLTVFADDELGHAAQLLAEHGISHLVVLDRGTTRPVGVLSTLDLAAAILV
jgi:CBS domain-containing protein